MLSAQTINALAATRGYNVFNANFATAYEQTCEYRTNGAAWLQPTSMAAPRAGAPSRDVEFLRPEPFLRSRVQTSTMSSRTVALVMAMLAASSGGGCNRGQTAGPPPAMPPTPVALAVAHVAPVDETTGVRRHPQVAALDRRPAANRRSDHRDSGQVRRPRAAGRAADADRRASPAGGRVEPGGGTRRRVRKPWPSPASRRSARESCSPPARSARRNRNARKRRCGRPRRT